MIKQAAIGLNSRSEANPYNEYGFLPLITAPMYSVVDDTNYQMFLDNNIQVCLPRGNYDELFVKRDIFYSMSLQEFTNRFLQDETSDLNVTEGSIKICIDTANGNIPALHDAIHRAKEIYGNDLIIMAGNVASVEAFVELAKTGADYIRVGIGGGGGCNTTSNTGVGQENLNQLISQCKERKRLAEYTYTNQRDNIIKNRSWTEEQWKANTGLRHVKIIADGISSWVKFCEKEYGYNDNGYAAINELLFAGADLVMIGKLFAQCLESASEKRYTNEYVQGAPVKDPILESFFKDGTSTIEVKYAGMSTHQEQGKYRPDTQDLEILSDPYLDKKDGFSYNVRKVGEPYKQLSPSEGSVQWIPVRWTLNEWLNGSTNQDKAPYLMGWINSIKSAMAYTGKTKL